MSNEHMPASTDTDKAAFSPDMAERAAARRREFAANRRAASEAWSKQKEAAGEAHREQDWLRLGGEQVDEAKARVEASELRLAYAKDDLMEKYLQHAEGDDASSPDVTVEDVMFEFAFKKSEIEAALSELQDRETRTPLDRERLTARIKAEQIKLDELVGAWHDIGGDAVDKTQEELVIAKAELASSEENVYAAMEARQAPKKETKEPIVPTEPSPTAPEASDKPDDNQTPPEQGAPESSNEASNEAAKEQSLWAEVLDSDELSIEDVRAKIIGFMNSKYESLRQGSDRQDADKFLREVLGMVDGYMHDRKSKKNAEWLEWDNQAKVTNLKNSLADYFKRLMREGNSAGEPGTGEAEQTESEASARSRAQEIIASYIADMKNAPVVSEYAPDADKKNGRQAMYKRAQERAATIEDEEAREIALDLLNKAYRELITTTGVGLGSLEQPDPTAPGAEDTSASGGEPGPDDGLGGLFRPGPSGVRQGAEGEVRVREELSPEVREVVNGFVERILGARSAQELRRVRVEANLDNEERGGYDGRMSTIDDIYDDAYAKNPYSERKLVPAPAGQIGGSARRSDRVRRQPSVSPNFVPQGLEKPSTPRRLWAFGSLAVHSVLDDARRFGNWLGFGVEPAKPADKQTHR